MGGKNWARYSWNMVVCNFKILETEWCVKGFIEMFNYIIFFKSLSFWLVVKSSFHHSIKLVMEKKQNSRIFSFFFLFEKGSQNKEQRQWLKISALRVHELCFLIWLCQELPLWSLARLDFSVLIWSLSKSGQKSRSTVWLIRGSNSSWGGLHHLHKDGALKGFILEDK